VKDFLAKTQVFANLAGFAFFLKSVGAFLVKIF